MKKIVIAKHGEVRIVRHESVEVSGQKIETKEDIILADSESTGNHHMLQVVPGVHVWKDSDADKFFVKPEVETKIYCKLDNRHTDYQLKEGYTYEIYKAREYDHINKIQRKIAD
jgi:hypothetical protein